MRRLITLGVATLLLAGGVLVYWGRHGATATPASSRLDKTLVDTAAGHAPAGKPSPGPRMRVTQASIAEVLAADTRRVALTADEFTWLRRHYYPSDEDLARLDSLDVDSLNGTDDPWLATLQGLALLKRGDQVAAMGVLHSAAPSGGIYAYEEAALAEYRVTQERLGPSIDRDDVLRGRLEVARILGDHRVDVLIRQYLPRYELEKRASIVQRHTTEFLRAIGADSQLRGISAVGSDPRPNPERWKELEASSDPASLVDVYVSE